MALEDVVWELDVISAVHLQGPVLEDAGGLAVRVGDDGLAERRVLHGVGHGRGAGGFGGEVIADDGFGGLLRHRRGRAQSDDAEQHGGRGEGGRGLSEAGTTDASSDVAGR